MFVKWIPFIGQCVLAAVINLLTFMFYKNMYGAKKIRKIYFAALYIISVILLVSVNQIGNPYVNSIYLYFSINIICLVFYESDISKVWLNNLLIWFIYIFCDVITSIIWSAFTGNTIEKSFSNEVLIICSNVMNIILMFVAYRFYLVFNQKMKFQSIQLKTGIFIITMTFFEIWISLTYARQVANRSGGVDVIIILIGFLLVDLFLAYILNEVEQAFQYKYELNLIKQLQKMQLENYKETERKYRESRAIIHDIKKHLDVAEELWVSDKDKAKEYREHIDVQMEKIFCGFHCSNRIMGIILDQKMSMAKSEGIKVDVSVDDVNIDFIDDLDITAIFANLWDNAIEACVKTENGKYINFSLSRYNGFILIDMENIFNGVCEKTGNKFKSTKKQHEGVGLSSISTSVNKYNGFLSTNVDENIFKVEITIPIPLRR